MLNSYISCFYTSPYVLCYCLCIYTVTFLYIFLCFMLLFVHLHCDILVVLVINCSERILTCEICILLCTTTSTAASSTFGFSQLRFPELIQRQILCIFGAVFIGDVSFLSPSQHRQNAVTVSCE